MSQDLREIRDDILKAARVLLKYYIPLSAQYGRITHHHLQKQEISCCVCYKELRTSQAGSSISSTVTTHIIINVQPVLQGRENERYQLKDFRALFRIGKWAHEFRNILQIHKTFENKNGHGPEAAGGPGLLSYFAHQFSRIAFILAWICENLYIVLKAVNGEFKITRQASVKLMGRRLQIIGVMYWRERTMQIFYFVSRVCWFLAVTPQLLSAIRILRKIYEDESDLKVACVNSFNPAQIKHFLLKLSKLRQIMILHVWRLTGDWLLALNELEIPFGILGKHFNRGTIGFLEVMCSVLSLIDYGISSTH